MSKDVRTFLLVLAGAVTATILLGSLVRAGETWAVPLTIAIAVLGFVGFRAYQKRRRAERLQELKRRRSAEARTARRTKEGGRNG